MTHNILKEPAQALFALPDRPTGAAEQEQLAHLSFGISGHLYAVNLLQIREVRSVARLTHVAHAPRYILGVTSIRGEIIPVLDLRVRFGLPQLVDPGDKSLVMVSEIGERRIGIRVDSVHDVIALAESSVQPIPRSTMAIDVRYLRGMVQHEGQVVLLVDLGKILDPQELHAVQASREEAAPA